MVDECEVVMMYYSEARCQTANSPLCTAKKVKLARQEKDQNRKKTQKKGKKSNEQTSGLNLGRLPGGGKARMEAKELASVTLCV